MPDLPEPVLEAIPDSFNWKLMEPFIYQDEILGTISIEVGFISDLGSVPRIFWNIVPNDGPGVAPYFMHDVLYARQTTTQKQADDFLLRTLMRYGVSWLQAHTIWVALRAFGWVAWASDGKKLKRG